MKARVAIEFTKSKSYLPNIEMEFSLGDFEDKPADIIKDLLRCIFKEDLENNYSFKILNITK